MLTSSDRDKATRIPAMSSMWDASPIPAPTGIPPLPTGIFFFPLGAAEEQERSCIEPSRDSIAWTCSVQPTLMLIDFNVTKESAQMRLSPAPAMAGSNGILYGPQPPKIQEQDLFWVTDLRDPGRGPALHFQTAYDKVVIFGRDTVVLFLESNLHRRLRIRPAACAWSRDTTVYCI
jgi:hypothetical protein